MERKVVSGIVLTLLLIGMLIWAFNIQQAEAAEPPATEWSRTYGEGIQMEANSLVQTSDGGYALAGGAAFPWTFRLIKTDATGNVQWSKTYAREGGAVCRSVVQTRDGGYALAGWTYSYSSSSWDFWLVKTDSNGNMQWNMAFGGTLDDGANSLVQTSDGGYALVGETESFGSGQNYVPDFWLIKTDSSGNMQWNRTYGGMNGEYATSVVQASDEGYALAGYTYSYGAKGDAWLVKTDSTGNMQWNKTYGGANSDEVHSIVKTSDGGYALAGFSISFGWGFWLVKTDSNGVTEWDRTYRAIDIAEARSLIQTSDNGYAMAGYKWIHGSESDFWFVKTDSNGNTQWNMTFGGAGEDGAISVVQATDGGYAIFGRTDSFGIVGDRIFDFWLIKLAGLTYTLTIHSLPSGVTFTVDGSPHSTPWSGTFTKGTSANLVLPLTHNGYTWSHWSDTDPNRMRTVTMNTNITLTAVYASIPEPVGGKATSINEITIIPVNKLSLLAPYIGLTILLAVAVATVVYAKKRKLKQQ